MGLDDFNDKTTLFYDDLFVCGNCSCKKNKIRGKSAKQHGACCLSVEKQSWKACTPIWTALDNPAVSIIISGLGTLAKLHF